MKRSKIMLIYPPQTLYPGSTSIAAGLPLGIMQIAAVLEKEGYVVSVLDAMLGATIQGEPDGVKRIGLPWLDIRANVEAFEPTVAGIGCPFTTQVSNAIQTASLVKSVDKRIITVVGGPHATVKGTDLLRQCDTIDLVVRGEGEFTMLEILQRLEQGTSFEGVNGIAYRSEGNIIENPLREPIKDLDELPFPAYHLVDMERYLNPQNRYRGSASTSRREVPMVTSRGCPFNCVFCSIHLHMGRKWRWNSRDYVLSHIKHLTKTYNVEHIHFEDDNLTLNKKRFEGIIDGVIDRGLRFQWDTPNGVRADSCNEGMLRKMKESGCVSLTIGVESGDQQILDNIIEKRLSLASVEDTARLCRKVGLKLSAFYIIGFPGEKIENMKRTVDFALRMKRKWGVNMHLFVATPLYGTRLFKICEDNGYFSGPITPRAISEGVQTWGHGLICTEDFRAEQVNAIAVQATRAYNRLALLDYVKHPLETLRLALTYKRDALRYLRSLAGL